MSRDPTSGRIGPAVRRAARLTPALAAALLSASVLHGCGSKGGARPDSTATSSPARPAAEAPAGSTSFFGKLFGRSRFGTIEDLVKAGKDQEALAFYEQNRAELRDLKPKERTMIDDLQARVMVKRLQGLVDAESYDEVPRVIDANRTTIDALPAGRRAQIEGFVLRARCGEFEKARRRGATAEALAAIERNIEVLESPESGCRAAARESIVSERRSREAQARELAARTSKLTASPKLASQAVWSELGAAIRIGTAAIEAYESHPLLRRESSEDIARLKSAMQSADKALHANARAAFLQFDLFGTSTFAEAYPVAPDGKVLSDACEELLPRLQSAEASQIKTFWSRYGALLADAQKRQVGQSYVDSLQRRSNKPGFVASLPFLHQAQRDGFVLSDWIQRIALLEAVEADEQDAKERTLALDVEAPREYRIPVVRAALVVAPDVAARKPPAEPAKAPASESSQAVSPPSADSRATATPASGASASQDAPTPVSVPRTSGAGQEAAAPSSGESGNRSVSVPTAAPIRIALGKGAKGEPVEIVLGEEDVRGKDMVIVVRFASSRSTQNLRDRTSVKSEYKSGERVLPNPAYLKSKREYEDAREEARAKIQAQTQANGGAAGTPSASAKSGSSSESDVAALRRYVEVLEGILATTPENLSEPVYSRYSYVTSRYRIDKAVRVQYVVYEVASKRMLGGQTTISESRDFAVAEGVRNEDKDFAAVERKYETIANMEGYAVRSLKVAYDHILADLRADIARRW
jgi:hypothetical protein